MTYFDTKFFLKFFRDDWEHLWELFIIFAVVIPTASIYENKRHVKATERQSGKGSFQHMFPGSGKGNRHQGSVRDHRK